VAEVYLLSDMILQPHVPMSADLLYIVYDNECVHINEPCESNDTTGIGLKGSEKYAAGCWLILAETRCPRRAVFGENMEI